MMKHVADMTNNKNLLSQERARDGTRSIPNFRLSHDSTATTTTHDGNEQRCLQ